MTLPYALRLFCLCCASFFTIHLALGLAAFASMGTATRVAERMKPSAAARLLFGLRIFPATLALLAVLVFCIPSYLWLEPEASGEKVGLVCFAMAALGVGVWFLGIRRALSAMRETARYMDRCERHGREISVPGEASPALLFKDKAPVLAMAGVFHPRLVISRRVLRGLSAEQINAALRHEQAHRTSGDNLKRLLMMLAPDVFPCVRGFRDVEKNWSKFTEWAADDEATGGDSRRALSLAAALVRVAKMGSKPQLTSLVSSLMDQDDELSERVDRLLRPQPYPGKANKALLPLFGGVAGIAVAAIAFASIWPSSLSVVHQALEQLIR
jgi:hypothetical protein